MTDYILLALVSLTAGFMDAVVGGGGLVMLPGLFAVLPQAAPVQLFGTNKTASVWGTGAAMLTYARRVRLPWGMLTPATVAAFLGALAGAWLVTRVSPELLRRALPIVLAAVLLYVLWRKQLGQQHEPRFQDKALQWRAVLLGSGLGLYDGFFGPGTGSFLIFLMVRWFGYDFLHASASAKVINVATNIAAIAVFSVQGEVLWRFAVVMALANISGGVLGSRLALRHGSGFVRGMFILIVSLLLLKTAYDSYLR